MFQQRLPSSLPTGSIVDQCKVVNIAPSPRNGFVIQQDDTAGPLATDIPCDVAVCDDCLAEIVWLHPQKLVGFAHHEPFGGNAAVELERAVRDLGLRG